MSDSRLLSWDNFFNPPPPPPRPKRPIPTCEAGCPPTIPGPESRFGVADLIYSPVVPSRPRPSSVVAIVMAVMVVVEVPPGVMVVVKASSPSAMVPPSNMTTAVRHIVLRDFEKISSVIDLLLKYVRTLEASIILYTSEWNL